jgi:hypothetical protein
MPLCVYSKKKPELLHIHIDKASWIYGTGIANYTSAFLVCDLWDRAYCVCVIHPVYICTRAQSTTIPPAYMCLTSQQPAWMCITHFISIVPIAPLQSHCTSALVQVRRNTPVSAPVSWHGAVGVPYSWAHSAGNGRSCIPFVQPIQPYLIDTCIDIWYDRR